MVSLRADLADAPARYAQVHAILSAGREAACVYATGFSAGVPVEVLFADREYEMNLLLRFLLQAVTSILYYILFTMEKNKTTSIQRVYTAEIYICCLTPAIYCMPTMTMYQMQWKNV
jgi:hypothetical protein